MSAALLLLTSSRAFCPAVRPAVSRLRQSTLAFSPWKSGLAPPGDDEPENDPLLQASTMSLQSSAIAEAAQCLSEIEGAVRSAREYLAYMAEVATVVQAYLDEEGAGEFDPNRPGMPVLTDTQAAKEYLVNIQQTATAAEEYLTYLEGVANTVRAHLQKLGTLPASHSEKAQEARTREILAELEETAAAAKDYLLYLKGVASAVREYLANPNSTPPPELANLVTPPVNGRHGSARLDERTARYKLPVDSHARKRDIVRGKSSSGQFCLFAIASSSGCVSATPAPQTSAAAAAGCYCCSYAGDTSKASCCSYAGDTSKASSQNAIWWGF